MAVHRRAQSLRHRRLVAFFALALASGCAHADTPDNGLVCKTWAAQGAQKEVVATGTVTAILGSNGTSAVSCSSSAATATCWSASLRRPMLPDTCRRSPAPPSSSKARTSTTPWVGSFTGPSGQASSGTPLDSSGKRLAASVGATLESRLSGRGSPERLRGARRSAGVPA